MKVVIAPDKFKDSLSASRAAEAIAAGIRAADPACEIDLCPMADGGEGTVEALAKATGGRIEARRVTGPLPEMKVDAAFAVLGDGETAVVEMAAASGLHLLQPQDRNPLNTTTFGTGELLLEAARLGAKRIILGIGGSATCDGGIGCAQGAGLTVLLEGGQPVSPTEPLCGRDLESVILVKRGRGSPVDHLQITVASDVNNPLFGATGAARVFGPQKGANPREVEWLDRALQALAERTGKQDQASRPGAGAAGGLGFGLLAFFAADIRPGIDLVIEAVGLRDRLKRADLCITGEGRLDASSLHGKAPIGVARLCKELGVPCIAIAGQVPVEIGFGADQGLTAVFSLCNGPMAMEDARANAESLLARAAWNIIRCVG
jgi:glycerate kinase